MFPGGGDCVLPGGGDCVIPSGGDCVFPGGDCVLPGGGDCVCPEPVPPVAGLAGFEPLLGPVSELVFTSALVSELLPEAGGLEGAGDVGGVEPPGLLPSGKLKERDPANSESPDPSCLVVSVDC